MSTGCAKYDPEMDAALNTDQLRAMVSELKGQLADERLAYSTPNQTAASMRTLGPLMGFKVYGLSDSASLKDKQL